MSHLVTRKFNCPTDSLRTSHVRVEPYQPVPPRRHGGAPRADARRRLRPRGGQPRDAAPPGGHSGNLELEAPRRGPPPPRLRAHRGVPRHLRGVPRRPRGLPPPGARPGRGPGGEAGGADQLRVTIASRRGDDCVTPQAPESTVGQPCGSLMSAGNICRIFGGLFEMPCAEWYTSVDSR
eukprot:292978-Prorocentrum_minimum.AAC.2